MTDEAKALVERLRLIAAWHKPGGPTPKEKLPKRTKTCLEAADLIETQAREIERLTLTVRKLQGNQAALEAELAKFKALADALASDIRNALSCTPIVRDGKIIYDCGNPWEILSAALRQYKEARDETSTL